MLKIILPIVIIQILNSWAQNSNFQSATKTESPWMVYFEVKGRRCGGALIDDFHVLTAAHCFDRIKYSEFQNQNKLREAVKIKVGVWKTDTNLDTIQDILPKEIIIHEKYNKRDQDKRYQYDIAVIKLDISPRRSEVVNVIRLTEPERCNEATSGEFWKITGFGGESKIKKKMEMVLLSHEECVMYIDQSDFGKLNEQVHVCGRGLNGEKTCKGDAGSPVTNLVESIPYLQGIVTFTDEDECEETETSTASVFLRVSCFYDWIHEKVPNMGQAFIEKPKPQTTQSWRTTSTGTPSSQNNNPFSCGVQKSAVSLIFGGKYISRGAYPWHAALKYNGDYICGATIISKNSVLTAAHCIHNKDSDAFESKDLTVFLGVHNLAKQNEIGQKTFKVKNVHLHPDWNILQNQYYDADIALLVLDNEITFSTYIQPICLSGARSHICMVAY